VRLANVTLKAVGEAGDFSYLNITVLSLQNSSWQEIPRDIVNGILVVTGVDTIPPTTNVTEPPTRPNETTILPGKPLNWTNKLVTLWFITMMIIENYLYTLDEIERRCAPL